MTFNQIEKPLISVLINCYNGDKHLKKTLDSVLSQTYENWEIIFWDNKSSDKSKEIFKSYNDNRFKYFYSDNHEILGKARKLAFEKINGEWLAILDCDDIWLPNRLELQINAVLRYQKKNIFPGIIYGRVYLINEDGRTIREVNNNIFYGNKFPQGKIFYQLLLKGNFIINSSTLINVKYLKQKGGFPDMFESASDYYLSCLISKDYPVFSVNQFISKYRVHQFNLTNKQKKLSYNEQLEIFNHFSKFLDISSNKKNKRINELKSLIAFMDCKYGNNNYFMFIKKLFYKKTILFFINFVLKFYYNRILF